MKQECNYSSQTVGEGEKERAIKRGREGELGNTKESKWSD